MRRIPIRNPLFSALAGGLFCFGLFAQGQAAGKPNIVIFFTDDTGYCDIGPFGGATPTPHLDRMADEGMKLTSFYVSSVKCSPSRAALMTGCYASQVNMNGGVPHAGNNWGLNPDEITLAEMLKTAGYTTACFGKWHLGDQPGLMPYDQGFDVYEGIPYSNDMWDYIYRKKVEKAAAQGKTFKGKKSYPLPWMKGDKPVAWIEGPLCQALMNDAIAEAAVQFVEANKDAPFFLYIPFPATHNPQYALQDRGERIAAMGCPEKAVHKYAQIAEIDACVGRVMDALTRHGISENTFLFYTNDNGGPSSFVKEGTQVIRGAKFGPPYEGNMRMSTLAMWPGRIPGGTVSDEFVSSIDLFPTLAKIAGGQVPADRAIDGQDVSTVLLDQAKSPHTYMYYEGKGIRRAQWKLVTYKAKGENIEELYDLDADPTETTNIIKQHPEIAQELEQALAVKNKEALENQRPKGVMNTSGPILEDPGGLPSLAEYLGRTNEAVYSGK
jgi:arylsulfatase A